MEENKKNSKTEDRNLTINNLKKGLFVKTNTLTKNGEYIYLYINKYYSPPPPKYNRQFTFITYEAYKPFDCKFTYILPKQSILLLKNNYVKDFEWEYYMKCLHRYDKNDILDKNINYIQKNALVKNLTTEKSKRGKAKRRSRPILIDFEKSMANSTGNGLSQKRLRSI